MPKLKGPSRKDRERSYHVSMWALGEENRLGLLTREQLLQRQKEIWENCFGDLPENEREETQASEACA